MDSIKEGYPLSWPFNWKRTTVSRRQYSAFRQTFARARDQLLHEIRLLGGKHPVISSNLMLKIDGFPYANQRSPEDSAVAVYFELFGKQQCIPCDKWKNVTDNLTAIQKTINALRGIERWGAKDMVEAAFRGFQALPAPEDVITPSNQYFLDCQTKEEGKAKYKKLARELHPDMGGKDGDFQEMQRQFDQRFKS